MSVDKRFALIDKNGHRRYPYAGRSLDGDYGFILGRHKEARRTTDIEEVIREVVLNGASVRAKALDGPFANQGNSLNLHAREKITGFYVAPEFVHLVEGSPYEPTLKADEAGLGKTAGAHPAGARERLARLRVDEVVRALHALQESITGDVRAMLEAHAASPDYRASIRELAQQVGPARADELQTAYRGFAHDLGLKLFTQGLEGLEALAFGSGDSAESIWVLRPQVLAALKETASIEPDEEASPSVTRGTDPQYDAATPTVRRALTNARVGQGGYRKRMLSVWGSRCAVTGCSVEAALVASHAKAWKNSTNDERLDEYNGLLLTGSLDRLFDAGLIAFANDGTLLCASGLGEEDLSTLGLNSGSRLRFVRPRHLPYLSAHRAEHGFS